MNKTFFRKTLATVLLFACAYMLAMSAGLPARQRAEAADDIPGTLDEYWNGNAEWVSQRKDTFASTGSDGGTLYDKVWADVAEEPAAWPYS